MHTNRLPTRSLKRSTTDPLQDRILRLTKRYTNNKTTGNIKLFETEEIRNKAYLKFYGKDCTDAQIVQYLRNIAHKRDRESYPRFQNAQYQTEELLDFKHDLFSEAYEEKFETYQTSLFDALQEIGIEDRIDEYINSISEL